MIHSKKWLMTNWRRNKFNISYEKACVFFYTGFCVMFSCVFTEYIYSNFLRIHHFLFCYVFSFFSVY